MSFDLGTTPMLSVAARTDRGLRRELNEDALFAADPCFIVADGMGGHELGDAASKAAISAFSERFTAPGEVTVQAVDAAIDDARARVKTVAATTSRGAGCTLSGAIRVLHDGLLQWHIFNIGDSRVYLQRGNLLQQLTSDHSLRSEMLAGGNHRAARTPRNIITRALGSDDDRHDAWLLPIETGSRLLVCTDGLTTEVADEQLQAVLAAGGRPESIVDDLMRRSLEAGGRDNVSIVLVDVLSGGIDMGELVSEEDDGTTIEITRPRPRRI